MRLRRSAGLSLAIWGPPNGDTWGVTEEESKDPFCKAAAAAELALAERMIGLDSRARLGNA